jgi:hypothetical protein
VGLLSDYEKRMSAKILHLMNVAGETGELFEIVVADPASITLLEQIAAQARGVRLCQREYFKTRSKDALIESKAAEAVLDKLLAEYFS